MPNCTAKVSEKCLDGCDISSVFDKNGKCLECYREERRAYSRKWYWQHREYVLKKHKAEYKPTGKKVGRPRKKKPEPETKQESN